MRKDAPPEIKEVLTLRLLISKSSISKYEAMNRVACQDGRARGLIQFYGASRTGRYASKLIQVQNLARNEMPDLAEARALVRGGDFSALSLLYDNVPKVLSELIRTAFIPKEGSRFIVADFSAIEARVIAWLAGESWREKVFADGKDIYCMSASAMFHVPVVKHGINGELRQKGKVAELACIAEDQKVLTDVGLIKIQDVTKNMKVWDGESWVNHEGVIYRGERKVITYDGLTATPDHLVYVQGKRNQYGLKKLPPAAHISYSPEMVGERYGWVKIISPEKRWNLRWSHCYVLTQCQKCGAIRWIERNSLTSGHSKGCQHCSQPRKVPKWLQRRLQAAKQRCENPKDHGYPNYGGRGIKFGFPSVEAAGLYIIHKFGLPDRSLQIDRINNNGDYAPGNIRMVPRSMNQANRRITVLSEFDQQYWPYGLVRTKKLISEGMTRKEIIESARRTVEEKRKNWRLIEARLEFMTYEMPDRIIVTPYRTS